MREQLHAAHEGFTAIVMEAFSERARRELVASGERVRRRSAEVRDRQLSTALHAGERAPTYRVP